MSILFCFESGVGSFCRFPFEHLKICFLERMTTIGHACATHWDEIKRKMGDVCCAKTIGFSISVFSAMFLLLKSTLIVSLNNFIFFLSSTKFSILRIDNEKFIVYQCILSVHALMSNYFPFRPAVHPVLSKSFAAGPNREKRD